jgi:hypothetical protein
LKPRLELGTQTHDALRPACRTSSGLIAHITDVANDESFFHWRFQPFLIVYGFMIGSEWLLKNNALKVNLFALRIQIVFIFGQMDRDLRLLLFTFCSEQHFLQRRSELQIRTSGND